MFSGLNFLLILSISLLYFIHSKHYFGELISLIIADISNFFMLSLVPFTIALVFLKTGRLLKKYMSIAAYSLFTIFILYDACIYKVLKLHFNSLVVNLILTKGGLETLEFSSSLMVMTALMALLVIFIEFIFYAVSIRHPIKFPLYIMICLLCIVIVDKSIYAYADLFNITYITRNDRVLPLYQPLTIKRFAERRLHMSLEHPVMMAIDKNKSILDYPKETLQFDKIQNRPNIIWIVIDSWRYDMITKDLTPNIYNFGKKALIFKNHYSGGNASRFGIFTLFYGIYGYYWFPMLGERRGPVFLDALSDLGYELRILLSSKVTFPEFDKTCFAKIPAHDIIDDNTLPSETKTGRDKEITEVFMKWLDAPEFKQPYFAFLFYDAPHGSYQYPREFERFTGTTGEFNYLFLNKKNIVPVFNRYRNSIYYDDYLVGKILNKLRNKGFLENTIVLITGDHGEAFFEKGLTGHNEGYSTEVVSVPLVLYVPGRRPESFTYMTSHLDVAPTILQLIGCRTNPGSYSQGHPLFDKNVERKYVVSSSWSDMAIIDSKETVVMPLELYRIPHIIVYDNNYEEMESSQFNKERISKINSTLRGLSLFLK